MKLESDSAADVDAVASRRRRSSALKIGTLLLVLSMVGLAYWRFQDALTLTELARHEASFRGLHAEHPILIYAIVFVVYVLVTAFSLPLASPMSMLIGWYFGFWRGLLMVSFASTLGATCAFLMTRYLLRDWFQSRFGDRLRLFNEELDREGAFYLFTLRLIPAVPFFVINAVMGLTKIRVWTFWWVSQVGMLAGTCLYVYAGSTIPSIEELAAPDRPAILTWDRLLAFAALGIFPLIVKKIMRWLRRDATDQSKQIAE